MSSLRITKDRAQCLISLAHISWLALSICALVLTLGCTQVCHVHVAQLVPEEPDVTYKSSIESWERQVGAWRWEDPNHNSNTTELAVDFDYNMPSSDNCVVEDREEQLSRAISRAGLPLLTPRECATYNPSPDCNNSIIGSNGGIEIYLGATISSSEWDQRGDFDAVKEEYFADTEKNYRAAADNISETFQVSDAYDATITVGNHTAGATNEILDQAFSALAKQAAESAWPKVQEWINTLVNQANAAQAEKDAAQRKKEEELRQSSDGEKFAMAQEALGHQNWALAIHVLDAMSDPLKTDPMWIDAKARAEEGNGDLKAALNDYRRYDKTLQGRSKEQQEVRQHIVDLLYKLQTQSN